jgi:glycosyltransferase involved in cell wall biosynthesis
MKTITFFTIGQAPHNTFTFKPISKEYTVVVYYLKEKISSYSWKNKDFFYPGFCNKNLLQYIIQALRSDLIVISGWQSYKYVILYPILLLARKKFALYWDVDIQSLKKYGLIKKYILQFSPIIFVTGVYGEKFMRRYLRKRNVFNFPYGIETEKSSNIISVNNVRRAILEENGIINVFISNRFICRKGYQLVRHLFTRLNDKGFMNNFHFVIAGNGELYEDEKRQILQISDKVKFLGWIEYDKYKSEMLNCDIFLHCSEFEPYGIPPVDAYCNMKSIVVTSKVYSLYDILEFGGRVNVFEYNKPEKLVDIFCDLLKNKNDIYKFNNHNFLKQEKSYLFENTYLTKLKEIFPN